MLEKFSSLGLQVLFLPHSPSPLFMGLHFHCIGRYDHVSHVFHTLFYSILFLSVLQFKWFSVDLLLNPLILFSTVSRLFLYSHNGFLILYIVNKIANLLIVILYWNSAGFLPLLIIFPSILTLLYIYFKFVSHL